MPRSGGTYTPPTNSWSPAVNGTLAVTADWNAILTDLAAALTQSVSKDGQTVMTGSLNMGGFNLSNVASAAIATITGSPSIASPTFTGVPVAPTAAPGTNTTQVATTAFVATSYAPLVSPALTGTPTAPTASLGTSTTQIATTAFVAATALSASLPGQAGNAGKFITTDGTNASWSDAVTPNVTQTITNKDLTSATNTFPATFASKTLSNPTLTGDIYINGSYRGNITAVGALDIDCSTANYFTKTIAGASTFTFSNAPSSRAFSFTIEVTHTSGTITWPASVQWPNGVAPTLTTGKTHLFTFVTDDGGTRWRGVSSVNYTN